MLQSSEESNPKGEYLIVAKALDGRNVMDLKWGGASGKLLNVGWPGLESGHQERRIQKLLELNESKNFEKTRSGVEL